MYNKIIRPKILSEPIPESALSVIPKDNSIYTHAKKAHIIDKDLETAEKLYRLAISHEDKVSSAIKDLSNVLHQQGRTSEAIEFLESHKHLCKPHETTKIENLLESLRRQLIPTGNYLNRSLVIFNVSLSSDDEKIKEMFENSKRIGTFEFVTGPAVRKLINQGYEPIKDHYFEKPKVIIEKACIVHFASNSAARKTLDTLIDEKSNQFYWMSDKRKIVRLAEPYRRKDLESTTTTESSDSEKDNLLSCKKVESFEWNFVESDNCWNCLVFPSLEEKRVENGFKNEDHLLGRFSNIHKLWDAMEKKQEEIKCRVMRDPDFVNKLLPRTFIF